MKKKLINIILVSAIALSSVIVISCSKEDKVNKKDNKNITETNSVTEQSNTIAEESVKSSLVIESIENKPVAKEIKMDKALKTKLDTFFSNFSEAFVEPFEEDNIDDEALIDFAISHIMINNWGGKNNMVEDRKDDPHTAYIHYSNIDEKTYRYFGKVVKAHNKNYYTFPFASGEAYTFSQIDKLYNIGDDFYTADISIYMASSGFTGDSHGTMDYWKKSNPHDVPALQKKDDN